MKVRRNRKTERAAVNAARSLFEACDCVFQEIDLGNDFGKDVYVDIADGQNVTGLCVALQVKGGTSYRRPGGYGIPLDDDHAAIWEQSSLPIAGVVFDAADGQLRWCNISEFLHSTPSPRPSYIPVDKARLLNPETLNSDFRPSFAAFQTERILGPALLALISGDNTTQMRAIRDCFILGRSDARVLILIRRLLQWFSGDSLRLAVIALAHATSHTDIFFHADNVVPCKTCEAIRPHLDWSPAEIVWLLQSADWDEWYRGGQGQNVYSLLREDPAIEQKIADAAISAMERGDEDVAFCAMYLAIYWAGEEGHEMYNGFLAADRRFGRLPLSAELRAVFKHQNAVTLFE